MLADVRGVDADLIVLEEAAFIDKDFFQEVIAPLMTVEGTILLGITTPPPFPESNPYSRMLKAKDPATNKTVFKPICISNMCDRCHKERRTVCYHVRAVGVPWKPKSGLRKARIIMADNAAAQARELFGANVDAGARPFVGPKLDRFRGRRVRMPVEPQIVFLGIDPAGGGDSSEFGCVSVAYAMGQFWVGTACMLHSVVAAISTSVPCLNMILSTVPGPRRCGLRIMHPPTNHIRRLWLASRITNCDTRQFSGCLVCGFTNWNMAGPPSTTNVHKAYSRRTDPPVCWVSRMRAIPFWRVASRSDVDALWSWNNSSISRVR